MAMKELIEGFGKQLEVALDIASKAALSKADNPIQNVFIAGMGGSGIGGQLVQSFTAQDMSVPIEAKPGYAIPPYVGKNTLFIACSFSGNTEETLEGLDAALETGAKITAVTSGGKLGELAKEKGFDTIYIPGESKSPRASIGYSFIQLLKIFHFHGLSSTDYAGDFKAAIDLLKKEEQDIQNQAKDIASTYSSKFPIIYADTLVFPLAVRIQQQINENAKQLAHANAFPEMNHNELVGWENPQSLFKNAVATLLQTDYDHERSRIRMNVCAPIFKEQGAQVLEVKAKGSSLVEQIMYLNHIFDWVSFYLAELNDVDPFPVEKIDYLKSELAKA